MPNNSIGCRRLVLLILSIATLGSGACWWLVGWIHSYRGDFGPKLVRIECETPLSRWSSSSGGPANSLAQTLCLPRKQLAQEYFTVESGGLEAKAILFIGETSPDDVGIESILPIDGAAWAVSSKSRKLVAPDIVRVAFPQPGSFLVVVWAGGAWESKRIKVSPAAIEETYFEDTNSKMFRLQTQPTLVCGNDWEMAIDPTDECSIVLDETGLVVFSDDGATKDKGGVTFVRPRSAELREAGITHGGRFFEPPSKIEREGGMDRYSLSWDGVYGKGLVRVGVLRGSEVGVYIGG